MVFVPLKTTSYALGASLRDSLAKILSKRWLKNLKFLVRVEKNRLKRTA